MKKKERSNFLRKSKGITLVSLVVTIIVLIILAGVSINAILGENGIITIAKQAKENMELAQEKEQTKLNELYTQISTEDGASGGISYDAIAELIKFKKQIANILTEKGVETGETAPEETMLENIKKLNLNPAATGDATEEQVLEGATFSNASGIGLTGTMPSYTSGSTAITTSGKWGFDTTYGPWVYIPNNGYYKTSHWLNIPWNTIKGSLGDAAAANVLTGKSFTSTNGVKISGSMPNKGAVTATINPGGSYTIPAGYHNGSGKVTANKLSTASQTLTLVASVYDGSLGNNQTYTYTATSAGYYMLIAAYHDYYENSYPVVNTLSTTGTQIYKYVKSSAKNVYYYSSIIYAYLTSGQTLSAKYYASSGYEYTSMGIQVFKVT